MNRSHIVIYFESTLYKLSTDMLNDLEVKLYQKLFIRDLFPGRYPMDNIFSTENTKKYKKCFSEHIFRGLSTDIYASV